MSGTVEADRGPRPSPPRRPRAASTGCDPLAPPDAAWCRWSSTCCTGFDGGLIRDLGVYTYGGQQVAEGVAPYVGDHQPRRAAGPPRSPASAAWVARQVGVDDLLGMRVLLMLISVGLHRRRLPARARPLPLPRWPAWPRRPRCSASRASSATPRYGPREKTALVLLRCCSASLAMVHQRWVADRRRSSRWPRSPGSRSFFAGIAAGAAVAALVGQRTGRLRALVRHRGRRHRARRAHGRRLRRDREAPGLPRRLPPHQRRATPSRPRCCDNPACDLGLHGRRLRLVAVGASSAASVAQLVLAVAARRGPARRTPPGGGPGRLRRGHSSSALLWSFKAFNGWPDAFFAAARVGRRHRRPGRAARRRAAGPGRAGGDRRLGGGRHRRWPWLLASPTATTTLVEQRADVDAVLGLLPADATHPLGRGAAAAGARPPAQPLALPALRQRPDRLRRRHLARRHAGYAPLDRRAASAHGDRGRRRRRRRTGWAPVLGRTTSLGWATRAGPGTSTGTSATPPSSRPCGPCSMTRS